MLTLPDDREKLNSLDLTLRNIISFESDRDVRKVNYIYVPTGINILSTVDYRRCNYHNGQNTSAHDPR